MSRLRATLAFFVATGLVACTTGSRTGTLAELDKVQADVAEVRLDDSLERAAQSYRRYLNETAESPRTPEAMRRLADLQLEQEYGVLGGGTSHVEMAAPQTAARDGLPAASKTGQVRAYPTESDTDFERRAARRDGRLSTAQEFGTQLPGGVTGPVPAGPREAIQTYLKILEAYPDYERNDQVLYQLSRAYDEIGAVDNAMAIMDRLVSEYPHSRYVDEVHFRRGEYFFVRKAYRDAEQAYESIIDMGRTSSYYELALYKLGWTLYKQDFYEDALRRYVAMLDHRQSVGHDFDAQEESDEDHRVADTFRVISLSFSNLGGPEVVDEYFSEHGPRRYADKIYGNLGEFYFGKLRYEDAASVYKSFIDLNPVHKVSPHFSMRVVEIYGEAGFPKLVVEAKKEFATRYALDAPYWLHFDAARAPEVIGFLKTNLTDLAGHYHALYQNEDLQDDKPANFKYAKHWYRQFLSSFPADSQLPRINYQLADLLLENADFSEAAAEYMRTAYEYGEHEQAAAAGYAAIYAHREELAMATGSLRLDAMQATVTSSLKFADTFQDHEHAPAVLGAAADDLYEMENFQLAIDAARKLVARYADGDASLRRSAWAVIAHSSIDLAQYVDAEVAYMNLLGLTPDDDDARPAIVDGLAAAIYKQGEAANLLGEHAEAAGHFLRIKTAAPDSTIRSAAEYDAAAALMKLEDWSRAAQVLEEFRTSHPQHELQSEATKKLAFLYREDGQAARAAAEYEKIAAESDDPLLQRETLLTAGELYDEAGRTADAVRVYERYVDDHPAPLDLAMETRWRLADIFKLQADQAQYHDQLRAMVAVDGAAGGARTDRSRYLAGQAALVLAQLSFEHFAALQLVQPFADNLTKKQTRMDVAIDAFEALIAYEVAEVTSAATFYLAEIYLEFSSSLTNSERPSDLSAAEMAAYEMAIDEEAYPFEERAIEVYQANFDLLASGIHNRWVQKSLDKLAGLMPGRYAKAEISGGYVGSLDSYAYRAPNAPPENADGELQPSAPSVDGPSAASGERDLLSN